MNHLRGSDKNQHSCQHSNCVRHVHLVHRHAMLQMLVEKTKKKLREVIKGIYPVLTELGLTLAFDKTWIGRVAKGFDFLGYRLSPEGLTVAVRSFKRMTEKLKRLYERNGDQARRRSYVTHWLKWTQSGVALNKERLLKTTTNILQDTVGFHSARTLLPE